MCWSVSCELISCCSAKVFVLCVVLYHLPQPSLAGLGFGVGVGGVLKLIIVAIFVGQKYFCSLVFCVCFELFALEVFGPFLLCFSEVF